MVGPRRLPQFYACALMAGSDRHQNPTQALLPWQLCDPRTTPRDSSSQLEGSGSLRTFCRAYKPDLSRAGARCYIGRQCTSGCACGGRDPGRSPEPFAMEEPQPEKGCISQNRKTREQEGYVLVVTPRNLGQSRSTGVSEDMTTRHDAGRHVG